MVEMESPSAVCSVRNGREPSAGSLDRLAKKKFIKGVQRKDTLPGISPVKGRKYKNGSNSKQQGRGRGPLLECRATGTTGEDKRKDGPAAGFSGQEGCLHVSLQGCRKFG